MQGIFIIGAILLGVMIPQAHSLTFLIRYSLMIMLFYIFLEVRLQKDTLQWMHLKVLIANLILPIFIFYFIFPLNTEVATAAFLIAAMPTAGVAPIIAGLLRSRVAVVTASILLTSPIVALALPFLFKLIGGKEIDIPFWDIMLPICFVIFLPLGLGQLLKNGWPALAIRLLYFKRITFILFLLNVFLASASASNFIQNDQQAKKMLVLLIAGVVAGVCLLNFILGEKIGGKSLGIEASLGLGRKNTMFGIWLALTFFNPIVALGPMFYILFQNVYNSFQIYQAQKIK